MCIWRRKHSLESEQLSYFEIRWCLPVAYWSIVNSVNHDAEGFVLLPLTPAQRRSSGISGNEWSKSRFWVPPSGWALNHDPERTAGGWSDIPRYWNALNKFGAYGEPLKESDEWTC
jgi:hypothetical protein